MATVQVPYSAQDLTVQQADGSLLLTWAASLSATGYRIYRSSDAVNFTLLTSVGQVTEYVDSFPGTAIMFTYYLVAFNTGGDAPNSQTAQMVAAAPSEMSLYELRLRSQQTADQVGSAFVTTDEWNAFLRLAMYELYDLLIGVYEDYAMNIVTIQTNGTTGNYPLPDGVTNFLGGTFPNTAMGTPAAAFYKLAGVDLNVNTSNITPARVTLKKFNFISRNQYIYPNSTSTIYGVYNMRYRTVGTNLNIIPTPSGNQQLTLYYTPRLPALLKDTDCTTLGTSGWLRYAIVRAAKYALDKDEGSDTSKLDAEILFLKDRIEAMASNRDSGLPDTISESRTDNVYGGNGWGGGGASGGGF